MKPNNQPIKEFLIKKLAINRILPNKVISERDIDAVITHQFDRAHNATNLYNSIEISGFGKFYFAQNKANKEMTKLLTVKELLEAKLLSPLTEKEERKTQLKLNTVLTNIKALKPKLITNVVD